MKVRKAEETNIPHAGRNAQEAQEGDLLIVTAGTVIAGLDISSLKNILITAQIGQQFAVTGSQ
jgi:hypothetical protein